MAIEERAEIDVICDECQRKDRFGAPTRVGCISRAIRGGWRLSYKTDLCKDCAKE